MIKLDSNTASILVAILGIIGILAPSIFSNYLFNRSDVDITIYADNNLNQSTLTLTNDGLGPATNISLLVIRNQYNFTSITYDKGTADISFYVLNDSNKYLQLKNPITFNSSFFKIIIQKLVAGLGSTISIKLKLSGEQEKSDYNVFLTYDQGSTNTFSNEPLNEFFAGIDFYKGYYFALFFISSSAITISIIITLIVRKKKIYIKHLIQQWLKNLLEFYFN